MFCGGEGIVRNFKFESGSWIYLIEMPLGLEPDCGRLGAETMLFINEADLSVVRCRVALKPRRLINKLMDKFMAHTSRI